MSADPHPDPAPIAILTGADVLARRLHMAGARHAFGIPGGEVLALIEALERVGIAFHLARHENAAGFMAEGCWHATGSLPVLVATVGPGIANAFNVIANCEQDRVPLIAISGMIDPVEAARYTHQVFDHGAAMASVTKFSIRLAAGAVDVQAAKAIRLALAPRQGPVHLDLPIAVATGAEPAAEPGPYHAPLAPGLPAPAEGPVLEAARTLWRSSRRRVAMAGLDVLAEPGGAEAVAGFCRRHNVPLVTTYKGKGILPEDDPLALGGHGLSPKADRAILPVFDKADCILSLGYDPIEMRTGWQDPWDPARVIEIAPVANDHDMHAADMPLISGVSAGLTALEAAGRDASSDEAGWHRRYRKAFDEAFAPGEAGPDAAMAAMLAALPEDAVATVDSGAHRILLSEMPFARVPRQLMQSTGLCTMGCALPLALGHAIGDRAEARGRVAVAFMGDGCAEMVLGELATLRDAMADGIAAPVVMVVFVDASLALIEMKQRRDQRPNAGVDYARATDFAALGRLFGGHAETVEATAEAGPALERAIEAARAGPGFSVLAVRLPRRAYDGLI
ncbi:MAG: thiamine pyrophosphate-binding protein [Pseudomonadota bacterium]